MNKKQSKLFDAFIWAFCPLIALLLIDPIKTSIANNNVLDTIICTIFFLLLAAICILWLLYRKTVQIHFYEDMMKRYDNVWQHYDKLIGEYYDLEPREYYSHNYELCKLKISALTSKNKSEKKEIIQKIENHQSKQAEFDEL